MRRHTFVSIILIAALVLGLASCGEPECQHRDADDDMICDNCGDEYYDGAEGGTSGLVYTLLDDDSYSITNYLGRTAAVVIPATYGGKPVTSIGDRAFRDCSVLTSVTIPSSVTSIGEDAFRNCVALTTVVMGDGVKTIGKWAFGSCSSLSKIVIPDGVVSISEGAFWNCTSLVSVVIPASVTAISAYAFSYCSALKSINYRGTDRQWLAIAKVHSWNESTEGYAVTCFYNGK